MKSCEQSRTGSNAAMRYISLARDPGLFYPSEASNNCAFWRLGCRGSAGAAR